MEDRSSLLSLRGREWQSCSGRRGELLFLPLLSPEQGGASGVDRAEPGCLLSLWTVARCLTSDLSSINFPQTGQAALRVPGVGEGGAVSDGVGRQEGGEVSLRQLRVLFTGSVLIRIALRVRGIAGVNISTCFGCFRVDLRVLALLVLGLAGVLTLGVSLK